MAKQWCLKMPCMKCLFNVPCAIANIKLVKVNIISYETKELTTHYGAECVYISFYTYFTYLFIN